MKIMTAADGLRAAVDAALSAVEEIEAEERSVESGRLLVAARVFAGAVELHGEYARIDAERKRRVHVMTPNVEEVELLGGRHETRREGVCAMELVAWLAGEPHSDRPACACPVVTAYTIALNDSWPTADRQRLKPYLARIIGTRATAAVEDERAIAALDWSMRVHRPLWLDGAGLTEHAAKMRALPEVVDEDSFRVAEKAQGEAIVYTEVRADMMGAWGRWDPWDTWNDWNAWDAWVEREVWDARHAKDAWDAWDAIEVLVAARAIDALGSDPTDAERKSAGVAAFDDVARKVCDAELQLLGRLIEIGA